VTPQGPNPTGGGPQEPEGAGETSGGPEPADDPSSDALNGWLPPEDRLWRHPSEVVASDGSSAGAPMVPTDPGPGRAPWSGAGRPHRRRAIASVLVATSAAAAVVVGVLLLIESGSPGPPNPLAGAPPSTTALTTGGAVPPADQGARQAMVALETSTAGGRVAACAVAVAEGGLLATTADAVRGARSITAVTAGGQHERATVVATDAGSDLALLRVSSDLPVARFTDDGGVAAGHPGIVMAVAPGGSGARPLWSQGTVESVGATVEAGAASGMAAIDATAPGVPTMAGALLLDPAGDVIGILDTTGAGGPDHSTPFLPTELVLGVAGDLASSGKVNHGWLEVSGRDAVPASPSATTTTVAGGLSGALVATVDPHGASAHVLKAGDVIVGADGAPVRTMAELRTRLYVLGPGTPVQLSLWRAGRPMAVEVDLSGSP